MIKGVSHARLAPIWYRSEPSDVLYSQNQFLGWDFFAVSYSKMALSSDFSSKKKNQIPCVKIQTGKDAHWCVVHFLFKKLKLQHFVLCITINQNFFDKNFASMF
jgi:hypothetical protein